MAKTCAESIFFYGAKVLYQHLSAMQAEVEGVKRSDDIEYIHAGCVPTYAQHFEDL